MTTGYALTDFFTTVVLNVLTAFYRIKYKAARARGIGKKFCVFGTRSLQKEAYWLKVPCITFCDEIEWTETVDIGWNVIVGADTDQVVQQVFSSDEPASHSPLYGDGYSAQRCVSLLETM
ncbi:hypothetical protein CSA56_19015 [candidate division KSB3 bacterium]|uniref:UDP-N-acetylglucosamine 2-epimerase domain-containing protein n=1 Tax=candidate division KSB3 bacterium TaxID=2044937 RepID=A0A2G6K6A2_9BACT|nr:MAG: hypothetical protein CSA56_19015 [candidate division KSB3 bacterium]